MAESNSYNHFTPKYKAQSTSQLLLPNSINMKLIPLTSSALSLPMVSSSSSSSCKFFLSNRKTTITQSSQDRYIMTLIRSPSNHSRHNSSNEFSTSTSSLVTTLSTNDTSNNSKFLKNKVTAAFNHMKYRK